MSILAAGFFVATAAAILLNALVWQRTRHPAPLFARATPAAPAKEPTIAGMSAVPASRPQPAVIPIQAHDKPVEKPPLEMPAGGHPRQTRVNSSPPHDVISQLLKAPPAPPRPTTEAAASAAPSKLVLAAQRALVKLGFVLNPDGVAGATTRQAIERYERDHGLPVRGDSLARHHAAIERRNGHYDQLERDRSRGGPQTVAGFFQRGLLQLFEFPFERMIPSYRKARLEYSPACVFVDFFK